MIKLNFLEIKIIMCENKYILDRINIWLDNKEEKISEFEER